jgi:HlyD family secretion protein
MNEFLTPAPARRLTRGKTWLLALGVLLLAALIAAPLLRRGDRIQYLGSAVQKGEIKDGVDATGIVNAVVNVQVGSQVSGTIAKLNADFNSQVHKGDVIALIDPQLLQGAVLQASADLENAKANVVAAKANLNKAKAALVQMKADFERARSLTERKIGAQQTLDEAKANYESARSGVDAAVAGISQAEAQVMQKEAALAVSRTNLNYTIIRSPIDGTVVARNVDVGQTVAASLQAPTIFTIAQDLSKMLVYAKVDESDVGRIRSGQSVTFKVDAFPKDIFQGTVTQIRMNPTSVQNVVTYDAIIAFNNPELRLFPGMTAYVTIPVATVENVVKIPNAALRFKPPMSPEAVRAIYAQHGIDPSKGRDEGAIPEPSSPSNARRRAREETAVVWKLLGDGAVEPVALGLGLTDHAYTEVTRLITGTLKPGDEVVTSSIASKGSGPGQGIRR